MARPIEKFFGSTPVLDDNGDPTFDGDGNPIMTPGGFRTVQQTISEAVNQNTDNITFNTNTVVGDWLAVAERIPDLDDDGNEQFGQNGAPILDGDGNPVLDGDGNPTFEQGSLIKRWKTISETVNENTEWIANFDGDVSNGENATNITANRTSIDLNTIAVGVTATALATEITRATSQDGAHNTSIQANTDWITNFNIADHLTDDGGDDGGGDGSDGGENADKIATNADEIAKRRTADDQDIIDGAQDDEIATNVEAIGANTTWIENFSADFVNGENADNIATNTEGIAANLSKIAKNSLQIDANSQRIDESFEGVSMAIAMGGTYLPKPGETFRISGNWGHFEGANSVAFSAAASVGGGTYITAGVGLGLDANTVGGRAGVSMGW